MYYTISGYNWAGNQTCFTVQAATEEEAETKFLKAIGGGEVNEIIDSFTEKEYKTKCENNL